VRISNAATTRAGINMDAIARVGRLIKDAAERTSDRGGIACAKFVCFANAVEDNRSWLAHFTASVNLKRAECPGVGPVS